MFRGAGNFNRDLSTWQVGKVTNMERSTYTLISALSPKDRVLFLAASISHLLSVAALILFLNNALSSFFFQPIFILGLFFVAVVQCLNMLRPSMVISPRGRSRKSRSWTTVRTLSPPLSPRSGLF